ncbi:DUF4013 domain-containing protein [[Eubacterium] cellulosolvens]
MEIGENLQNAWNYTKQMTTDIGRWVILLIIGLIPIVNFIIIGYMARIVKETPSLDAPPRLEHYLDLWIQGLKIIIILLIYMVIPLILFGIGIATMVVSFVGMGGMRSWPSGLIPGSMGWNIWPLVGVGGIMVIVGIIIAFLIAIIAIIGIVHMIKNNQLGKAFAFGEIANVIGKIGWGKYILWLIIILIINFVFGAIGNIPWIGWLITLIFTPPFMVFVARSIGLIYGEYASESFPPSSSGKTRYCIQCGASIPIASLFCPKCGNKQ